MVSTRKRQQQEADEPAGGAAKAAQEVRKRQRRVLPPAPTSGDGQELGSGSKDKGKGKGKAPAMPGAAESQPGSKQAATEKKQPSKAAAAGPAAASVENVSINRAPVLTLWVAVVAQREGYSWEEGLTFGRLVSGMLAQSKGRKLGIYEEHEKSEEEVEEQRRRNQEMGVERVQVFGMKCPAVQVGEERHAVSGGSPVKPSSVQSYLSRAFDTAQLSAAKEALETLAAAVPAGEIGKRAYKLYEQFRPEWKGWGVKGQLSLSHIRQLAETWRQES